MEGVVSQWGIQVCRPTDTDVRRTEPEMFEAFGKVPVLPWGLVPPVFERNLKGSKASHAPASKQNPRQVRPRGKALLKAGQGSYGCQGSRVNPGSLKLNSCFSSYSSSKL